MTPGQVKSLYEIPPGCICQGDGLLGMRCSATTHATKRMTSGRVAYEGFCGGWEGDGVNLPGWLQRPWEGLDYRRQAAWELAAAAVIRDIADETPRPALGPVKEGAL